MYPQLPLDISPRQHDSFDDFWVGENDLPVSLCRSMAAGEGEQQAFLWGGNGGGKTHLLNATCVAARDAGLSAILVPCHDLHSKAYRNDPFEALEQYRLVCVDDIHALAGHRRLERHLFNLINRVRQTPDSSLLFAANVNPNTLVFYLPDLHSRLSWGPVLKVHAVSDADLDQWLCQCAAHMGMQLPPRVASYMANRYPRHMPDLLDKLQELNRASIAAQRTLTVRFVKMVLEGATYGEEN